MILRGATSLLRALDFQGPPLPMPLIMMLPLKIITYPTIKTTGTLIVIKTTQIAHFWAHSAIQNPQISRFASHQIRKFLHSTTHLFLKTVMKVIF
jgi:hypothetical protein